MARALSLCSSFARNYEAKLIFIESPKNPFYISFGGKQFFLEKLQRGYQRLLHETIVTLEKDLLFGFDCSTISFDSVHDECSKEWSKNVGLVLSPLKKTHLLHVSSLSRHVMRQRTREFIQTLNYDKDGNLDFKNAIWKTDRLKQYQKSYDSFLKLLMCLIHVGSGMPARASELATYSRIDSKTTSRTLRFELNRVFFQPFHNKTNWIQNNTKQIARFLDPILSRIVLIDSLLIRPFMNGVYQKLNSSSACPYLEHYFVSKGTPISADLIRKTFTSTFGKYFNTFFTISEYRHVVKYVVL